MTIIALWALGVFMGHDWIFDVLADLRAYALANGLPALADKADEALQVATQEILAKPSGAQSPEDGNSKAC
jgi:hypothetical protein